MIESLTPEQEATFPYYVKKWVEIGNSVIPNSDEFYTRGVVEDIKDAIVCMYETVGEKIDRENILESTSPIMSPFVMAAHMVKQIGKPKTLYECTLPNSQSVEDYVNQFANQQEIIQKANECVQLRMWGSTEAGLRAYIDFFQNETELGETVLKPYSESIFAINNIITPLTYDLLLGDNVAVWSRKQVFQTFDTSGEYPVAVSGDIKWCDGTIINY